MKYDAFISYAHRVDNVRATALQRALQRLAKPFLAWKALNVFRDETSLSANPALWPSIERALEQSRFFIFMACPDSADASPWCRKEINWWLANRSPDTFLIVLTGGELVFDENTHDFDWSRTTALPREVIQRKFNTEPFYRDLRWAQHNESLSLANARFRAEVLPLAATLHGKEPHERFLVVREVNKATPWDLRAGRALTSVECTCQIRTVVFSPDGNHFAVGGDDGTVRIRRLAAAGVSRDLTQVNANSIVFSPDGTLLVISEDERDLTSGGTPTPTGAGWLRVWDIRSGRELVSVKQSNGIGSLIVSPDSKYIAGYDRVWESRTGHEVTRVKGRIVAFSPDMSFLFTTENNVTGVWVWRPDDLIAAACRQLPRNLTREEWRSYLGNEPYRKTCDGVPKVSLAVLKDIASPAS